MRGMDKLETLQADEEKQFNASEAAAQPLRDREMKELMTPVQARSHLEKLKDAPKPEDYQKGSMEFASSMALVGAVFGRFSRRGGTAALNAFSGALKGWHEGNMEAYGNAQKEWEENTKKTLANNQMEIEKYKEIIENKKLNIDQMSAAITIATAPFQNKLMFDYGQEKNINGVLNLYDKMVGIQERLKSSTETLLGFNENDLTSIKSSIDQYNAHPEQLSGLTNEQFQKLRILGEQHGWTLNNPAAGISLTATGGARGMGTPDDIKEKVEGIKSGNQPPTTTGLYGNNKLRVEAELQRQGVNLAQSQLQWLQAQQEVRSLNSQRMIQYVGLAHGLTGTIDRAEQTAKQMNLSGLTGYNYVQLQELIKAEGNSERGQLAVRYLNDVNAVKGELANLENGGYAPTDPAWKIANEQVNSNYGVKELSAALDEVKKIVNYRVNNIPGIKELGAGAANRYTGQTGFDPAAQDSGSPVKVSTPEEAQKLAPGTHYVTPDNQEFTR